MSRESQAWWNFFSGWFSSDRALELLRKAGKPAQGDERLVFVRDAHRKA